MQRKHKQINSMIVDKTSSNRQMTTKKYINKYSKKMNEKREKEQIKLYLRDGEENFRK